MKNLNKILNKVISSNVNWRFSMFYLVIEILKKHNIEISHWEGEEYWATMSVNNKTVGYIWKKYPLIILENNVAYSIIKHLNDIDEISYIESESLESELFIIDDDKLKSHIDIPHDIVTLTMEELWFNTAN